MRVGTLNRPTVIIEEETLSREADRTEIWKTKQRSSPNLRPRLQSCPAERVRLIPFRAMVFGEQADKMIAQGTSVIKLSLGEPDFGAPPAVRDAMREQYDGRALPYTAAMGLPELRQAIADFYRERHDLDIDPKRICVTAGVRPLCCWPPR